MLITHHTPFADGNTSTCPAVSKDNTIQPLMKLKTNKLVSQASNLAKPPRRIDSPKRGKRTDYHRGHQVDRKSHGSNRKRTYDRFLFDLPKHPVGSNHYYKKSKKFNVEDFSPKKKHSRTSHRRDSHRGLSPKCPKIKSIITKVPNLKLTNKSPTSKPPTSETSFCLDEKTEPKSHSPSLEDGEIPPTPQPPTGTVINRELFPTASAPTSPDGPLIVIPNMEDFNETPDVQPGKNNSQCMFHLWSLIKHIDRDVGRELATLLERKGYLNKNL